MLAAPETSARNEVHCARAYTGNSMLIQLTALTAMALVPAPHGVGGYSGCVRPCPEVTLAP